MAWGCSGSDDSSSTGDENALEAPNPAGDAQTPPSTGFADLEAWLAKGDYKKWACETVDHPQMKVSPHGQNRVCSNDLVATFKGTVDDERPIGSASVKELYDDDSNLVGYATGLKVANKSDGGSNWYWYERVTRDSSATPTENDVIAIGLGSGGAPKSTCVGCHAGAGSDAMHAITGSSDFVYLQIAP